MARVKSPHIFSLEDLVEYYRGTIPGSIIFSGQKIVPAELEKERKKVLSILKQYETELLKVQEATVKFAQQVVLNEPTVYIARTKDTKTEIEYLTAKTFWPLIDGNLKEIKIYLGKASEFNNDTKSKKAKEQAVVKMRQTIARRLREGSL